MAELVNHHRMATLAEGDGFLQLVHISRAPWRDGDKTVVKLSRDEEMRHAVKYPDARHHRFAVAVPRQRAQIGEKLGREPVDRVVFRLALDSADHIARIVIDLDFANAIGGKGVSKGHRTVDAGRLVDRKVEGDLRIRGKARHRPRKILGDDQVVLVHIAQLAGERRVLDMFVEDGDRHRRQHQHHGNRHCPDWNETGNFSSRWCRFCCRNSDSARPVCAKHFLLRIKDRDQIPFWLPVKIVKNLAAMRGDGGCAGASGRPAGPWPEPSRAVGFAR